MTDLALSRPFSPLRLESRSLAWQAGAVIVGSLLLALSSQIKVPMYPVPMTMQTFAVTLVGALYGWRLGAVTVIAWLAQGAMGLPVFAGAVGGAAYFAGPTGGYLLAFDVTGLTPPALRGARGFWVASTSGLVLAATALSGLLWWVLRRQSRDEAAALH